MVPVQCVLMIIQQDELSRCRLKKKTPQPTPTFIEMANVNM